jgi:hypothetical protein
MATFVAVGESSGMTDGDERKQALGPAQDPPELVKGVVFVSPLEGPDDPRMERVVPRSVGDVRDAWEKLTVQGDTWRLHTEVIETSDRLGRTNPGD